MEAIYGLIAKAMGKIRAIGKDSTAQNYSGKFMYKFRGIDAVYNALNPVMSELGLFVVPEVLEQTREERQSTNGGNLIYSILKMRFTMYAPDSSNVSCVVIGEGMDSGDKASNKAMSVALKYAMFQLFMIPTEEMAMDDPDRETHETTGGAKQPTAPKTTKRETVNKAPEKAQNAPVPAQVQKVPSVPQTAPETAKNPVLEYMARERENLRAARQISKAENTALWSKQVEALKNAGMIPNKALSQFTQAEAEYMVSCMYSNFPPTGSELKANDGKTA
jgi:hypothetical protein